MSEQTTLEKVAAELAQSSSKWTSFRRAWQTLTHYRWNQIAIRACDIGLSRIQKNRVIGQISIPQVIEIHSSPFEKIVGVLLADFKDHIQHRQSNLTDGKISLLNREIELGYPLEWDSQKVSQMPHLWRFQLQYHEFLLGHLAHGTEAQSAERRTDVIQALQGWCNSFPPQSTTRYNDSWHPFCISRRIPIWISILVLGGPNRECPQFLINSLYQQGSWLSENLETGLGGNHLLENVTALAMAGSFLKCPQSKPWLQLAENHIAKQLQLQTLPSGEHFERSPMYHCQILRNLLLVALTSKESSPDLANLCRDYAERMLGFLMDILHPDDEIPLFGDSGFGEAPSVSQILSLAQLNQLPVTPPSKRVSTRGDYWIIRSAGAKDEHLIFDAGPVAAPHLPAHAHCDHLGIELSIGRERWFVDSGNFNYGDDSIRQYCRSSLAHNVSTINNANSCNIWSRFRMGNRGSTTGLSSGKEGKTVWATSSHDGYRHLAVKQIKRLIAIQDNAFLMVADFGKTSKKTQHIAYLHLAPQLKLERTNCANQFLLSDSSNTRYISFFGVGEVAITDGWYCRGFGFRDANQVFVYRAKSPQQPFGWLLSHQPNFASVSLSESQLSITTEAKECTAFDWDFSINETNF